jgi:hypothetical protein
MRATTVVRAMPSARARLAALACVGLQQRQQVPIGLVEFRHGSL